jgi:hypothetical protein
MLHQQSQHGNTSTDPLTTIKCHSLQWDVQFKYTKVVSDEEHGRLIQLMDGTSKPHLNIINAIEFMSRRQKVKGYQTQYFSSTDT